MSQTHTSSESLERLEQTEIDSSCRKSVLFFYACAIFWLIVGTLFGFIASVKLQHPNFFSNLGCVADMFTFGRIRAIHTNVMVYGWGCCAAFGTGIWLMARMCHAKIRRPRVLLLAAVLWNLGVFAGCNGIAYGSSTSIEWLEFPRYAGCMLLTAYMFIGSWVIMLFYDRRKNPVFISQWYILAAFFWFPWFYTTAHFMLLVKPASGVIQAIVSGWYANNLLGLWFASIAIATAYYLIPKITGKPIHAYSLSIPAFLSFALFYSWSGANRLIGGPIPVWIQSVSVVAGILMIIPVFIVGYQFLMTLRGHFSSASSSPVLSFTIFGVASSVLVGVATVLTSSRTLNAFLSFTHTKIAFSHMALYAFFSMMMFGAMYYIIPRLASTEWPSLPSIRMHYMAAALGIVMMVISLTMAGISQALDFSDPSVQFVATVAHTKGYMATRSISGIFMAVAHITFAISFIRILVRASICCLRADPVTAKPTLS